MVRLREAANGSRASALRMGMGYTASYGVVFEAVRASRGWRAEPDFQDAMKLLPGFCLKRPSVSRIILPSKSTGRHDEGLVRVISPSCHNVGSMAGEPDTPGSR